MQVTYTVDVTNRAHVQRLHTEATRLLTETGVLTHSENALAKDKKTDKRTTTAQTEPDIDDFLEGKVETKSAAKDDTFGSDFLSEANTEDEDTDKAETKTTLEDVRAALRTYSKNNGLEKTNKILAKFKVTATKELKESDFAKVIALANK